MKRFLRLYRAIERIEELGGKACWIFGELCEIGKRLRNVEHDIERIMAALEKADIKVGSGKGSYWEHWDKTQR